MNKFYVVNVWYDGFNDKGGYKVMACAKSLYDAALTVKLLRRPSECMVVRDGSNGKRYSYADLIDSWTGKPLVAN